MKRFYISEISLLSKKEKAGRKIKFSSGINIIHGSNGTGKSSLIKSIYHAFGANVKWHPKFKKLNCIILVKFSIDEKELIIVRDGNNFGIFNKDGSVVGIYSSITEELSLKLADLFDFKLELKSHPDSNNRSKYKQATPAFLFLPYYIDQDKSWSSAWKSFEGLTQFSRPEQDLINYHLGIYSNEYYELKHELLKVKEDIKESNIELEYTSKISKDIKKKLNVTEFNIDINSFTEEIEELLIECNKLKEEEDVIKDKLKDLYGAKRNLNEQIDIVEKAIEESKKDYKYANEVLEDEVECPTCGANYENSFVERFSLAMDEDGGRDLLIQLFKEAEKINEKINTTKNKVLNIKSNSENIKKLLDTKKEAIKLDELFKNYGKNEVRSIFNNRIDELYSSLGKDGVTEGEIDKRLKEIKKDNKIRSEEIKKKYKDKLGEFLELLSVGTLKEEDYKSIYTSLDKKETGSAMPRALLAYYFTFFYLMRKYGSSAFCPIVIDSPNQQAQDYSNVPKILSFIKDNRPLGSQLILGLEEFHGVDFETTHINELKTKEKLLMEDQYNDVNIELSQYIEKLWL